MRKRRIALLAVVAGLMTMTLTGCLFQKPGRPQAMFVTSSVEMTIPFAVNFDATPSYDPDGEIVSYQWTFGDGSAAEGPVVSHTYEENGDFEVKLTVVDDQGITDSDAITVSAVNPPPEADFTYSPRSWDPRIPTYVVGTLEWIFFNASDSTDDGEVVSYRWNFGDGEEAEGVEVKHRYLYAYTYPVTLIVTDEDGGETRVVQEITVVGGKPCNGDICE
jgi:PKD repeat protein